MIIMADTNLLINLVEMQADCRIVYQFFEQESAIMALPTPAIAEFLAKDDNQQRSDFLAKVNNFTQVFNFDLKSACMSAKIVKDLYEIDYFKRKKESKQQVHIQILGICLANQIPQIFTGDYEIKNIVNKLQLPIKVVDVYEDNELFDLPLFSKQFNK